MLHLLPTEPAAGFIILSVPRFCRKLQPIRHPHLIVISTYIGLEFFHASIEYPPQWMTKTTRATLNSMVY
jgi:hypothetical protein